MEGTIKKVKIQGVIDLELEGDQIEFGQFDGNGNWNSVFCSMDEIPKIMWALEEFYRFWLVETELIESSIVAGGSEYVFSPSRQDE